MRERAGLSARERVERTACCSAEPSDPHPERRTDPVTNGVSYWLSGSRSGPRSRLSGGSRSVASTPSTCVPLYLLWSWLSLRSVSTGYVVGHESSESDIHNLSCRNGRCRPASTSTRRGRACSASSPRTKSLPSKRPRLEREVWSATRRRSGRQLLSGAWVTGTGLGSCRHDLYIEALSVRCTEVVFRQSERPREPLMQIPSIPPSELTPSVKKCEILRCDKV